MDSLAFGALRLHLFFFLLLYTTFHKLTETICVFQLKMYPMVPIHLSPTQTPWPTSRSHYTNTTPRKCSLTVFPPTSIGHYDGWSQKQCCRDWTVNWSLGWTVNAFTHFWPNSSNCKWLVLMDTFVSQYNVYQKWKRYTAGRAAWHCCPQHSWLHIVNILGFCQWHLIV